MQQTVSLDTVLEFQPIRYKIFSYLFVNNLCSLMFASRVMLKHLQEYFKNCKSLKLKQRDFALLVAADQYQPLFALFTNIQALEINCRRLKLSFLKWIPKRLTYLKLIDLKQRHIFSPHFYSSFAERLTLSLLELKLHYNDDTDTGSVIPSDAMSKALASLKNLKSFVFKSDSADPPVLDFIEELYLILMKLGSHLTSMELTNLRFQSSTKYTGLSLPNLHHLAIYNKSVELAEESQLLSPSFLLHVTNHYPSLVSLNISEQASKLTHTLSDNSVLHLARAYPTLQRLELCYRGSSLSIPHVGLMTCFNILPELRELVITSCKTLDAASIRELVQRSRFLCRLHLDYSLCDDFALQSIAESYSGRDMLKSLSLKACGKISEDGFKAFFAQVHGFEELDVTKNYHITSSVLQIVIFTSPRLRKLRISHCEEVGNEMLCTLLTNLRLLENLYFSHMLERNRSPITADCFESIGLRQFERIRSLSLIDMENLDDSSVQAIVKLFPNLEKLKLSGCKLFTKNVINVIQQSNISKQLKVLIMNYIPSLLFNDSEEVRKAFSEFDRLVNLQVDCIANGATKGTFS